MANVVVVGSQWGDEGKGKIVDWLSEQAAIVVRFQGGHNAGHTLVVDSKTFKLSLLPSGIVRPGKLSGIGNGVVLDPAALIEEIERVRSQGIAVGPENLRIAENATLILSLHRELDGVRETSNPASRIGTTKRGIGPAYEDKVGRRAIRLMDLADLPGLELKIARLRARNLQSLYEAGRRRAVPDRAEQRHRYSAGGARPRVRHGHRPGAALRLVRFGPGAPDGAHQRHPRPGAYQARHPRRFR